MKKFWILFSLFIVPLLFYLFLLMGTNHFAKLAVLTKNIHDISAFKNSSADSLSLKGKITVLAFLGDDLDKSKNNAFNLNEKIYKHFYGFKDFQIVAIVPFGMEEQAEKLKKELSVVTDMSKWYFVFGSPQAIKSSFESLRTPYEISLNSYSPYAFIIDKDGNLRGRDNDENAKDGYLYGYNAETVSSIHNEMVDDVKVLLAEYRLALKKNKRKI
ncbi:MAG: hypothetical protein KDC56_05295 [Flavobacteriaceae bacterium]|nr:hypothetical protein [Flavobacteriaceae bacterium]